MRVLVTYSSKHGATAGIAERIGFVLREAGVDAEVWPAGEVGDVEGYDAVVAGSAVYLGSWLKDVTGFLRRNAEALVTRPVWLFSSGPVGNAPESDESGDLAKAVSAKQLAELEELVHPRDHRVFFGAVDRHTFGIAERLFAATPAGRKLLPEGDFRDWADIEAWAGEIAADLAAVPA